MLPAGRAVQRKAAARDTVVVDGDQLRLVERGDAPGRTSEASAGALPLSLMLDVLVGKVRNGQIQSPINLRVSPAHCLVRTRELPAAARPNAERLLAVDLERSTPFKLADVLTACDVSSKAAKPGVLTAHSYIVKRKSVDPIADALERVGIQVAGAEVVPEGRETPLPLTTASAATIEAAPRRMTPAINLLLACAILLLAASAAYLQIDRREKALAALEARNATLKARALDRRAAAAAAEAAMASVVNYRKLRSEYVSRSVIIEELSRILPDSAWVADLKIDGSTLDITGQAKSAPSLVPKIEASRYFVDAAIGTTVAYDPREEKERFTIRARIRGSTAPAAMPSLGEEAP